MAELTGEAVVTVHELTVNDYAAADTGAEGNHDEVFDAACGSVCHFADGSCVGVIGYCHRDAEFFAEELCERHRCGPRQVHSVLNHSGEVVCIGSPYAYSVDFVFGSDCFYEPHGLGVQLIDIVGDVSVLAGFDGVAGEDYPTGVDDTENSVGTAHVNAYNIRLAVYH